MIIYFLINKYEINVNFHLNMQSNNKPQLLNPQTQQSQIQIQKPQEGQAISYVFEIVDNYTRIPYKMSFVVNSVYSIDITVFTKEGKAFSNKILFPTDFEEKFADLKDPSVGTDINEELQRMFKCITGQTLSIEETEYGLIIYLYGTPDVRKASKISSFIFCRNNAGQENMKFIKLNNTNHRLFKSADNILYYLNLDDALIFDNKLSFLGKVTFPETESFNYIHYIQKKDIFVAEEEKGLTIFSIKKDKNYRYLKLGFIEGETIIKEILNDNRILISKYDTELDVYEITDDFKLKLVKELEIKEKISFVKVFGNILCVCDEVMSKVTFIGLTTYEIFNTFKEFNKDKKNSYQGNMILNLLEYNNKTSEIIVVTLNNMKVFNVFQNRIITTIEYPAVTDNFGYKLLVIRNPMGALILKSRLIISDLNGRLHYFNICGDSIKYEQSKIVSNGGTVAYIKIDEEHICLLTEVNELELVKV